MHDFIFESLLPYPKEEVLACIEQDGLVDTTISSLHLTFSRHTKTVEPVEGGCVIKDRLEYKLPWLSQKVWVKKTLSPFFSPCRKRLENDLNVFHRYDTSPLKVLLTGSSGMVGSSLLSFLRSQGHDVWVLKRSKSDLPNKVIGWDPTKDRLDANDLEGFDVVVHLAGENIGKRSWTKEQKERIFQSRCRDTWLLCHTLSKCRLPPKVFLSASAIGIYGDCGNRAVDESSSVAQDFLADICQRWEGASKILLSIGVRCIQARFGLILDPRQGALAKMLPSFRAGLGGRLGSGKQIYSWVALDDAVYALYHCMKEASLQGPVNVVSEGAVTQSDFAKLLAQALNRWCFFSMPAFVLRVILGERADALLLRSAKVKPLKLVKSGFTFLYENLSSYFKNEL